ncbi:MAG TPA: Asp23/Gls24 family envelope stress response protein [Soehngenia sp.]|nr:Asp23/Gls24 family envelope stress response protein [Soehngenia sp.]
MPLIIKNEIGSIFIEDTVIQEIVGLSVIESYGVVDKASKDSFEGIFSFFGFDPSYKGIKVTINDNDVDVDIYLILEYGVKISTVCQNIIERVKYNLKYYTGINIGDINIFVQGIRTESDL